MPVRRLPSVRRPAVLVNAVLGVAIAAGGTWAYTIFVKPESSAAAGSAGTRTVAVAQGRVTSTVSASGTVRSAVTASAEFATAGTVSEIRVKVGDVVKKGAVLARVDPSSAKRQLTAAEANLDAAEAALDRATDADSDTTDAEAQVTSAELAVEEAQEAVDGSVLKAPMAGTVVAVNGSVGGSSGGGSSGSSNGSSGGSAPSGSTNSSSTSSSSGSSGGFIELADLNRLEVSASVAEADATKLKVGQAATVTWNALAGATATGKLTSIDPNASTSNNVVTYGVVFSLDRLPDGVRAGQTVEVSATVGQVDDVVYVNSAALTTVGNRHTVTVLQNGRQVTRTVEVGLTGDQAVEITSGLEVGEQVVLKTSSTSTNGNNGFPGGGPPGGGFPGGGGFTGGGINGGRAGR
ncbi:efflux RND transporter periplasmic adaptor subunit [Micromonospora chaiyaphumensis]|uniref:Membrane fusion protein, macrolide-specific efflux system n=1 Tax=Micromonospora chaiyaphumensis TaxID=307119 RepID=A0A1C4VLS7_9ACTN|nr:efflux RND transporter periplasmic adaptor subunit [Micromonospora chaiyaphumensis]SCE84952.1 membrane fusion protein, macrolide-specific efflux system [Micromonospora chaiyaphumensis]